ncbi:HpcH/HpaI aldolase/citrate lyase family protein [Niveispirillum sp. KHB5.9]|uniref:HpcH/HpaI aldolase/citrate lyase family protein n=1 Tax=Niveispirillum sp. KHB5.9 TaxID=3400269 RepID=UPI003A8B9335
MLSTRWRSLLFVPADDGVRRGKAAASGADAVILDLEDGVAPAAKPAARAGLEVAAAAVAAAGPAVVVRVNAGWLAALEDLKAAIGPDVRAIMVPKVEDVARLTVLSAIIDELEAERGLPPGHTGLIVLVESPAGLAVAADLAACPRVIGLALGPEDFAVSMGVAPTPALLDLPSRQVALAAATRGLMALAVPLSIAQFRDVDACVAAAGRGAEYGVTGALCIHPNQVRAANQVFQPSAAELDLARRVLAAWDNAQAAGAAVTTLDGSMVDLPVVLRARALLARAPS